MSWRAFIAVAALASFHGDLLAIDCIALPPCARLRAQSILFTGIVASADIAAGGDTTPQDTRIEIDESFAGLEPGDKAVTVEVEGSWMEKGHSYLVDAWRGADGRLYLDPCGTSGETTEVRSVLDFLRRRAAGKATTSLEVHVTDGYKGVADARATISGPEGRLLEQTDAEGDAMFSEIKPGRYQVVAERAHFHKDIAFRSNDEADVIEGTCADARFGLQSEASIGGLVLDAKGAPVAGLTLELVKVPKDSTGDLGLNLPLAEVQSSARGEFRFDSASPGLYYLGVNLSVLRSSAIPRTYYPGRRSVEGALPIEVKPGEDVGNLVLNLPDFGVAREIQICVVDELGKPSPAAAVHDTFTDDGNNFGGVAGFELKKTTDQTGCVSARGFTGVAYAVYALGGIGRQIRVSDDVVINPGEGPARVLLTLKKQ
jgi:hypothetical protein